MAKESKSNSAMATALGRERKKQKRKSGKTGAKESTGFSFQDFNKEKKIKTFSSDQKKQLADIFSRQAKLALENFIIQLTNKGIASIEVNDGMSEALFLRVRQDIKSKYVGNPRYEWQTAGWKFTMAKCRNALVV